MDNLSISELLQHRHVRLYTGVSLHFRFYFHLNTFEWVIMSTYCDPFYSMGGLVAVFSTVIYAIKICPTAVVIPPSSFLSHRTVIAGSAIIRVFGCELHVAVKIGASTEGKNSASPRGDTSLYTLKICVDFSMCNYDNILFLLFKWGRPFLISPVVSLVLPRHESLNN